MKKATLLMAAACLFFLIALAYIKLPKATAVFQQTKADEYSRKMVEIK